MRPRHEGTDKAVEFIKEHSELTAVQIALELDLSERTVRRLAFINHLPMRKGIDKIPVQAKPKFFNVHSHYDWLCGKFV